MSRGLATRSEARPHGLGRHPDSVTQSVSEAATTVAQSPWRLPPRWAGAALLRDLARRVGTSHGRIHHFGSREALLIGGRGRRASRTRPSPICRRARRCYPGDVAATSDPRSLAGQRRSSSATHRGAQVEAPSIAGGRRWRSDDYIIGDATPDLCRKARRRTTARPGIAVIRGLFASSWRHATPGRQNDTLEMFASMLGPDSSRADPPGRPVWYLARRVDLDKRSPTCSHHDQQQPLSRAANPPVAPHVGSGCGGRPGARLRRRAAHRRSQSARAVNAALATCPRCTDRSSFSTAGTTSDLAGPHRVPPLARPPGSRVVAAPRGFGHRH